LKATTPAVAANLACFDVDWFGLHLLAGLSEHGEKKENENENLFHKTNLVVKN
jgi:hypothetical protein